MLKEIATSLCIACVAPPALAGTTESLTRLEIDTFIDIPASPEMIWDILADVDRYPELMRWMPPPRTASRCAMVVLRPPPEEKGSTHGRRYHHWR
ncbi:hypothetical protein AAFO90_20950 [Phaeobacter sp. CAU 1743]|uniref:hypothetical protein n=1 Tax=Phaeobacter sp. CAU 1743 TaxID=3140367 RepID=UPI0023B5BDFB